MLLASCHSASVNFVLETNSPPQGRPRVAFRIGEFDRIAASLNLDTDASKAAFLGVSAASLSKIRSGVNRPSADFIAAIRIALPSIPYERLFAEERS